MPLLREVVLDSNVIAGITLASDTQRDAALARIEVAKRKGSRFLLSATGLTELGATYHSTEKLDRLLVTIQETCDGVLPTSCEEMLQIDATEADPYSIVTSRNPLPIEGLTERVKLAVQDATVRKFYEDGAFGNAGLRHLLDALDPLKKRARGQVESFPQYVEARRIACLKAFLELGHGKGYVPHVPDDLEALWKRSAAWRFLSLMSLANEFRRLTGTHTKGEGCLSDIRTTIEAAYSHQIWTADWEFAECGKLVNRLSAKPALFFWNPRSCLGGHFKTGHLWTGQNRP